MDRVECRSRPASSTMECRDLQPNSGIVAALLVTRVLGSLLFGVSTLDPLTFGVVLTLLVVVAAVASYVPARRAARVDPLVAMRGE